jgi:uncharacterized protein
MVVLDKIGDGLWLAVQMAWEVWWALVLGFLLSAVVQALVPRARMQTALGGSGLRPMALATGLGAASSSCSYAAVAIARSNFAKGSSFATAMAFQFASTNLVFELGIVLWVFIGWQFTAAELIGGIILIALMWLGLRLTVTRRLESRARRQAEAMTGGHHHGAGRIPHNFLHDWKMLWKEIVVGFLIAGFIALAPADFFNRLFITDAPEPVRLIQNVIVGPLVAVASFVCSVGNVPLAAVLWAGGISFAGVIAFIYADLIIVPLVIFYAKAYGRKMTVRLVAVMFVAMAVAALIVDGIFSAAGLVPTHRPSIDSVASRGIEWNYTTVLNILAFLVAGVLFWLALRERRSRTSRAAHATS